MESISTDNLSNFLDWAKNHRKLKVKSYETPFQGYTLHDVGVKIKAHEDKVFLSEEDVFNKLRRGHCVAKREVDGEPSYKIVRKGLIKFFDLQKEFKSEKEHKRVLGPVETALSNSSTIRIYMTEKANGENLQISYDGGISAWVVASKNVTIVCRDKEDISWYQEDKDQETKRYEYVCQFAYLWFEILEREIISEGKLDEFIRELSGYTLLGEHIDLKYQHIKLYKERTIIFFGLVRKDSEQICMLPERARDVITKYGLSFVGFTKSASISTQEELLAFVCKAYVKTLNQSVEEGGEGSVVYFVEVPKDGEDKVVSLGKLKTFEYRFLRKLREKLKSHTEVDSVRALLKKVSEESKQILKEEGDEINLNGLLELAHFIVLGFREQNFKHEIFNNYATFVSEMKKKFEIAKEEGKNFDVDLDEVGETENFYREDNFTMTQGLTYFIAIYGLVGSGKSTLQKMIAQYTNNNLKDEVNLLHVSNDQIRGRLIKEFMEENPGTQFDEAYNKTKQQTNSTFRETITKKLDTEISKDKVNLFLVDKNFDPKTLKGFAKNNCSAKSKIVVFYPKIKNKISHSVINLPFSLNYFAQCYLRLIGRKEHETLSPNKNEKIHRILFSFLLTYKKTKDFEVSDRKIQMYPLTFTDEEHPLPKKLHKNFVQLLSVLKDGGFNNNSIFDLYEVETQNFLLELRNVCNGSTFYDTLPILKEEIKQFFKKKLRLSKSKSQNDEKITPGITTNSQMVCEYDS